MRKTLYVLVIALVFVAPLSAYATQLTVNSYSMHNGDYGSFNYTDYTYVPCNGVCSTQDAWLSGGTGKLTDGVLPPESWYQEGYQTKWVGWYPGYRLNPLVTFNFANTVTINSVTAWFDNTPGYGDVRLPASVSIDGTSFSVAADSAYGPRAVVFSGLNVTGTSIDVQFIQPSYWIMVGEVTFNGNNGSTVPLPGAFTLLAPGLVGLAAIRRRFKK